MPGLDRRDGGDEAGLLGQDMMSKLGDAVWRYPIEVTEGIKDDESNFLCPSFLSLQTYRLASKHNARAKMLFIFIVPFIFKTLAAFIKCLNEKDN